MTPERSQMTPYTSDKASSLTGSGLAKLLIILLAITAAVNVVVIARTNLGPPVVEGERGTIFIQPDSSFYARRVRVEIALIIAVIGFWLYRARRKAAVAVELVSLGWVVVEYLLWLTSEFKTGNQSYENPTVKVRVIRNYMQNFHRWDKRRGPMTLAPDASRLRKGSQVAIAMPVTSENMS